MWKEVLWLEQSIQTIYILENPESKMTKFATAEQLQYGDIIKEVFGVACLNDIHMMIQYNKCFQESISKKYGINSNTISINNIVRVASKEELDELKKELINNLRQETELSQENPVSIPRPFDSLIKLRDGIFSWNEESSSYIPIKKGA